MSCYRKQKYMDMQLKCWTISQCFHNKLNAPEKRWLRQRYVTDVLASAILGGRQRDGDKHFRQKLMPSALAPQNLRVELRPRQDWSSETSQNIKKILRPAGFLQVPNHHDHDASMITDWQSALAVQVISSIHRFSVALEQNLAYSIEATPNTLRTNRLPRTRPFRLQTKRRVYDIIIYS